jgi:hypothetical protein
MNIDRINQLIDDPFISQSNEINSLKELTEKFPYAQLFSILYLKALKNNQDIRFEDELKQQAFKISDREKLYSLIYKEQLKSETPSFITPEMEEEIDENFEEKVFEISLQEEFQTNELPTDVTNNDSEEIEEFELNENKDELEQEYLSSIISATYSLEKEEKNSTIKNDIDLNSKRSFNSWLQLSDTKNSESNSEKIIKKFISDDPKIKPIIKESPKTEFYSPIKKAKESVDENNLLYSETLANIYAMQGNFPKAIKAFNHLMLTIPEKKLYFAEKIKELNKKLNL